MIAQQAKARVPEPVFNLTLKLESLSPDGDCLAFHEGQPVQVSYGIPGEEVVAEVRKLRSGQLVGEVKEVLTPSPHRVVPRCPYFGPCGGCQWQHMSYDHQLELKRQVLREHLESVGGFRDPVVVPMIPSEQPWHYRNHARFTVRKGGQLGFVHRRTHRFVPIDYCYLVHPWINHTLALLQGRCGETTQLSFRYGARTGKWLLQPTLQSPDIPLQSGQTHYQEELLGRPFRISSPSFFQVNTPQAEALTLVIKEQLRLSGREVLVDAYAGVGTFAMLLAPYVQKVIAIEEATAAVEDAKVNMRGLSNVRLIEGKTERVLLELDEQPDALILDPPRTGCLPQALEAVRKLQVPRVAYISCDPQALARDLKLLCEGGLYRVAQVQPIDMFPQTYHLECVALLELAPSVVEKGTASLALASTSPRRREILELLGLPFDVVATEGEEDRLLRPGESLGKVAERLALAKAQGAAEGRKLGVVIGGDTLVVPEGVVLGKPQSPTEARLMLRRLRNRTHQVVSGVAVVDAATGMTLTAHRSSSVTMRSYTDREVEAYIETGDPFDKAGAYAIQASRFKPVAHLEGCYQNVVGLPLCALASLLQQMGIEYHRPPPERLPRQCHLSPNQCPLVG